jgi:hypothetical protein
MYITSSSVTKVVTIQNSSYISAIGEDKQTRFHQERRPLVKSLLLLAQQIIVLPSLGNQHHYGFFSGQLPRQLLLMQFLFQRNSCETCNIQRFFKTDTKQHCANPTSVWDNSSRVRLPHSEPLPQPYPRRTCCNTFLFQFFPRLLLHPALDLFLLSLLISWTLWGKNEGKLR